MPNTQFFITIRLVASGRAVAAESLSALGNLSLSDGGDVDGDGIELYSC